MKKILFVLFALLVCPAVFSQEGGNAAGQTAEGAQKFKDARVLLIGGLNRNFDGISDLAAVLPVQERLALYDEFAFPRWKRIAGPLLNFGVGFGVGSFIQGDNLWGGISLAADCVGLAAGVVGAGMLILTMMNVVTIIPMMIDDNPYLSEPYMNLSLGLFYGGMALVGANRIASGIRSLVYPGKYDSKLKRALLLDNVAMDIEPALVPSSQGIGLALVRFIF